ncbi:MAG: carboxy-S-adenosyl-L-methionine synthase CmoA [Proteobacteria bacterium]|nr:carboxy-S-adenosyl-L-methionine synthase CmoA [Pseudomonadota bacterium]
MTTPSNPDNTDRVYALQRENIEAFRFDATVADVFQDMIERSVPGYALVLQLVGVLAERYAHPGTRCYDLGCSLGASTLQLRRHVPSDCLVIGIDNSAAMVERCQSTMNRDHSSAACEIRLADIRDSELSNASIILLNFTLQFIPDGERQAMLNRIYDALIPGGVLLLAEKVRFDNNERQQFMTNLHHDFKKHQGYSDLEISQKRAALENVLVPNTFAEHEARLRQAGFTVVESCARCLNFEAIMGVKSP